MALNGGEQERGGGEIREQRVGFFFGGVRNAAEFLGDRPLC